ncbi:MAG: type II secretion system protein [Eubacterium sp.]|nr:type II secretion system protein [Eubacterium sp.]
MIVRNYKGKLHNNRAFTLAETLVAILILLMVSSILASGIPVAKKAYDKVVVASNAEVLLSTTISALRNELGTARNVNTSETTITFFNETLNTRSRIYLADGSEKEPDNKPIPQGTIIYQRYYKTNISSDDDGTGDKIRLVSAEASNKNLIVTYGSVAYSGGIITFTDLKVLRETGGAPLAERPALSIRLIAENH